MQETMQAKTTDKVKNSEKRKLLLKNYNEESVIKAIEDYKEHIKFLDNLKNAANLRLSELTELERQKDITTTLNAGETSKKQPAQTPVQTQNQKPQQEKQNNKPDDRRNNNKKDNIKDGKDNKPFNKNADRQDKNNKFNSRNGEKQQNQNDRNNDRNKNNQNNAKSNNQKQPFNKNQKGAVSRPDSKPMKIETFVKEVPNNKFSKKAVPNKKEHDKEKKELSEKQKRNKGFIVEDENTKVRTRIKTKKQKEEAPAIEIKPITHAMMTSEEITVREFSEKISKPSSVIVKALFELGIMATINSTIKYDVAELVADSFAITLEKKFNQSAEEQLEKYIEIPEEDNNEENWIEKPPVVTVMGHVDHGKTSLLDAIRETNVIASEAGGITQHIGAYTVNYQNKMITFLDTPGHEAFSAMRQRGAQATDIAILIVAADDGIMPQTKEAIKHIKRAQVPMIVAINKIDKEGANIERTKQQLADNDVLPEEWGGDVPCIPISAKRRIDIDKLLETILLVAELQELKANPKAKAIGVILEAKLDKGQGPVATVLIQNGTLNVGDNVISGISCGKVRAILDEKGKRIKSAGPSMPVSIIGLDVVPNAGDRINEVDEKMMKDVIEERKNKLKDEKNQEKHISTLDELIKIQQQNKVLNIIIKSDTQGTAQALKSSITAIENEEVSVKVLYSDTGAITENDIITANTSNATIVAFNQKMDTNAKALADRTKADVRQYSVIYSAIDDLTALAKSMMDPKYKENPIGKAEIRQVFKLSTAGIIAGCYVTDGKVSRKARCRVIRDGKVMAESEIVGLKHGKEDIKEIGVTYECGIKLDNYEEYQAGDILEVFTLERIN